MKLNLNIGDEIFDFFNFGESIGIVDYIEDYLIHIKFNGIVYYYPYKTDGDENSNHHPRELSKTKYSLNNYTPIINKIDLDSPSLK